MSLRSDKRQNIQMELDFSSAPAGEAREAGREETESLPAVHEPESLGSTNRLMEEVCERENLKEAFAAGEGSAVAFRNNSNHFCFGTLAAFYT